MSEVRDGHTCRASFFFVGHMKSRGELHLCSVTSHGACVEQKGKMGKNIPILFHIVIHKSIPIPTRFTCKISSKKRQYDAMPLHVSEIQTEQRKA